MDPTTNLILTALAAAGSQMLQQHAELRNAMVANKSSQAAARFSTCFPTNKTIYPFTIETLSGGIQDLAEFKGKVVLVVNVATFCEHTNQYLDFNGMIEQYGGEKFSIVAFPCNQFHYMEPGENREILNGLKWVRPGGGWTPHTDLRIFGKVDVNGDEQHPLYAFLEAQCPQTVKELAPRSKLAYNTVKITDVTWNFEKFLIDKKGRPRYRFHPTAWLGGKVVRPFIERLIQEQ